MTIKEKKEKNSGEIVLELAGFRPLPLLVRSLELAGEQLALRRAEEFVYDDWNEEQEKQADSEYITSDSDDLLDAFTRFMSRFARKRSDNGGAPLSKVDSSPEPVPDVPQPDKAE